MTSAEMQQMKAEATGPDGERRSRAKALDTSLDRLRAEGYAVIRNAVPEAAMDAISADLAPWFDATPRCRGDFYGWKTTRFGSLLSKAESTHRLVLAPRILGLVDAILGPHCDFYQLNLSQAVRIHPGERAQVPHRDEEMWPCRKGRAEYLVNVMWALDDFTFENGATRLWPRSQFASLDRGIDPDAAVAAEMPRGSALVFLGSLTHGGGANTSAGPRTGIIFSYCLGWLKQYENQFLAYPPAVAKRFPKLLRDLIGYRIHRPNLGGYEGQDPSVLFESASSALPAVDALPETVEAEVSAYYAASAEESARSNPERQ